MAHPSTRLVLALRQTAARLSRQDVLYSWASFAHCNCGHLAQTITGLDPSELQRRAMRREGDWGSQARDGGARRFPDFDFGDRPALDEGAWEPENVGACQVTGAPLDEVLDQMYLLGMTVEDVGHLERLSSPEVRRRMGNNTVHFPHGRRENVVAYLTAWADLLEEQLADAPVELYYAEAAE
ncbi:MAG: hypothetical protein HKP36_09180 [Myxococcales bacterium]|nr:hypothetical protein [Deltaproteobacteria bacterium]NNL24608.1 hypothetical protein [Myxococcales bacterium]